MSEEKRCEHDYDNDNWKESTASRLVLSNKYIYAECPFCQPEAKQTKPLSRFTTLKTIVFDPGLEWVKAAEHAKLIEEERIRLAKISIPNEQFLHEEYGKKIERLEKELAEANHQKEIYRLETHRWKKAYDLLSENYKLIESRLSDAVLVLKIIKHDFENCGINVGKEAEECLRKIEEFK